VATRLLEAIQARFTIVLDAPLIGAKREQFAAGLRVTFYPPYAIYYLPIARELIIVRVLHGARDVVAIAEQGGFGHD
jgi:toxin ParE1/3/4